MEGPQPVGVEIQRSIPAQHVESSLVRFLKSRLPGEKTARNMKQIDALVGHLPENAQELVAKVRPVIKAGMYAGNCVGTYMEAMLVATIGAGAILVGKSALINRKDMSGAFRKFVEDAKIKDIPKNLAGSVNREVGALKKNPREWLKNAVQAKPTYEREPAPGPAPAPVIETAIPAPQTQTPAEAQPAASATVAPEAARPIRESGERYTFIDTDGAERQLLKHPAQMSDSELLEASEPILRQNTDPHVAYLHLLNVQERNALFAKDRAERALLPKGTSGEERSKIMSRLIMEHKEKMWDELAGTLTHPADMSVPVMLRALQRQKPGINAEEMLSTYGIEQIYINLLPPAEQQALQYEFEKNVGSQASAIERMAQIKAIIGSHKQRYLEAKVQRSQ